MDDSQSGINPHQGRPGYGASTGAGNMDIEYLKSKLGLLKIAEFVLLLIAFASLTGYTGATNDKMYGGRYDFFYFTTILSWLIVLAIFLLFFVRLHHRVNINWNLVLMVYSTVTAFLLLLSSALILGAVIKYRKEEEQQRSGTTWVLFCSVEKCGNIEAAGAFGIISTAFFLIDAVFFFLENRRSVAAPPQGAEQF